MIQFLTSAVGSELFDDPTISSTNSRVPLVPLDISFTSRTPGADWAFAPIVIVSTDMAASINVFFMNRFFVFVISLILFLGFGFPVFANTTRSSLHIVAVVLMPYQSIITFQGDYNAFIISLLFFKV